MGGSACARVHLGQRGVQGCGQWMRPAPRLCGAGSGGRWCKYLTAKPRDFLAVATPGAGKTTFALRIVAELLAEGTVETVTVVVPTEHLKTQWAQAAARMGIALDPKFSNSNSADVVGVPRRRRHLRPGGQPPDPAPGAHREPQDAGGLRRDPPRRGRQELGRRHPGGVRRRDPTARADRDAVPQRRHRDPVRHLRAGIRRLRALAGRPHLRLLRRPGRRRGASGDVHGLLRGGPLARQRGRGARGPARRAADRRADRTGVEDRAEPGRRVDARGDRRGRHPAARPARARARRRRHDHRLRPDRRPRLRRAAGQDHR